MAAELSVVYNYKDFFSTEPVVLVVSLLLSSCEKLGINATKIVGSELLSLEGIEMVYVSKPALWVVSHVTKTSLVVKETRAHA